ncbi:redoxin domain-containing protein, partial [Candidatus Sumerlaeota bacterium]|nr:redoxin domain-containing protein [Candidatus Sumerlaeota bacterium]
TDTAGTTYSIESYRGRLVVGEFWSARCPHVARSETARQRLAKKCGARGVVYLAIDSCLDESPDEMKQYLADRGSTYTVIVDDSSRLAKQFNATRTPEAFVLDRDGVVRFIGGPFSPEQWAKGDPDRADWLEDALDAALEGRSLEPAIRPVVGSRIRKIAVPIEPWL